MQPWLSSDARSHTKEAASGACLVQLRTAARIKDELELWYSNQGGLPDADWGVLSEAQKATKWITERCSKLNASVFAQKDCSAVKLIFDRHLESAGEASGWRSSHSS